MKLAFSMPWQDVPPAALRREALTDRLVTLLGDDGVIVIPTAHNIPPPREASLDDLVEFREKTLALTCVASLARLPQVSLPVASCEGCPVGLSLIGGPRADARLLGLDAAARETARHRERALSGTEPPRDFVGYGRQPPEPELAGWRAARSRRHPQLRGRRRAVDPGRRRRNRDRADRRHSRRGSGRHARFRGREPVRIRLARRLLAAVRPVPRAERPGDDRRLRAGARTKHGGRHGDPGGGLRRLLSRAAFRAAFPDDGAGGTADHRTGRGIAASNARHVPDRLAEPLFAQRPHARSCRRASMLSL